MNARSNVIKYVGGPGLEGLHDSAPRYSMGHKNVSLTKNKYYIFFLCIIYYLSNESQKIIKMMQ